MNGADMSEPGLHQIHAKCWFEGAGLAKTVLGTWVWAVCSGAAFSEAFLVTFLVTVHSSSRTTLLEANLSLTRTDGFLWGHAGQYTKSLTRWLERA